MVKQFSKLDAVFGALSDPTRRKILERLARGELTAGELAAGFDLSQPAISKHLKILEVSDLAKRKVGGRNHHFRLAPSAMTPSFDLDSNRACVLGTLVRPHRNAPG